MSKLHRMPPMTRKLAINKMRAEMLAAQRTSTECLTRLALRACFGGGK